MFQSIKKDMINLKKKDIKIFEECIEVHKKKRITKWEAKTNFNSKINIKVESGDIYFYQNPVDKLKLHTDNGNIYIAKSFLDKMKQENSTTTRNFLVLEGGTNYKIVEPYGYVCYQGVDKECDLEIYTKRKIR